MTKDLLGLLGSALIGGPFWPVTLAAGIQTLNDRQKAKTWPRRRPLESLESLGLRESRAN